MIKRYNINHGVPNPCTPDCDERSATCHADCPKYAKFRSQIDEKKEQNKHFTEMADYDAQVKSRRLRIRALYKRGLSRGK